AFVDLAKRFASEIRVCNGSQVANGKSLIALLTLGVAQGPVLQITAQGPDADKALGALKAAVEAGLGDQTEEAPASLAHAWVPAQVRTAVRGLSASPGLAIGRLHELKRQKIVVEATARDPEAEELELRQAIAGAQADLERLSREVEQRSG